MRESTHHTALIISREVGLPRRVNTCMYSPQHQSCSMGNHRCFLSVDTYTAHSHKKIQNFVWEWAIVILWLEACKTVAQNEVQNQGQCFLILNLILSHSPAHPHTNIEISWTEQRPQVTCSLLHHEIQIRFWFCYANCNPSVKIYEFSQNSMFARRTQCDTCICICILNVFQPIQTNQANHLQKNKSSYISKILSVVHPSRFRPSLRCTCVKSLYRTRVSERVGGHTSFLFFCFFFETDFGLFL